VALRYKSIAFWNELCDCSSLACLKVTRACSLLICLLVSGLVSDLIFLDSGRGLNYAFICQISYKYQSDPKCIYLVKTNLHPDS
jgi:hypothetical protein